MKKFNKNILVTFLPLLLASCGGGGIIIEDNGDSSTTSSDKGDYIFTYEDPAVESYESHGTSVDSTSSRVTNFDDLDVQVMAKIEGNGLYTVEAEDCDLNGCTLQEKCAGFFEYPATQFPTSGGACIACIVAPSVISYQFTLHSKATVEFFTVCAKYESNWSLDDNVEFFVDSKAKTLKSNYVGFGNDPASGNNWYNWKQVSLGSLELDSGLHQVYISVVGAFPNTDCFKMNVTNYQG